MFSPFRPSLTALETRENPSASISFINGVITIQGFDTATTATVTQSNGVLTVEERCPAGCYVKLTDIPVGSVERIIFYGDDGNDTFKNSTGIDSTAYGGEGNDTLTGGWGTDKLYGQGDDDNLNGGQGEDWLYGGSGNDRLNGGDFTLFNVRWADVDHLSGGSGADTFVRDMAFTGSPGTRGFYVNQDAATDFSTSDGDVYV